MQLPLEFAGGGKAGDLAEVVGMALTNLCSAIACRAFDMLTVGIDSYVLIEKYTRVNIIFFSKDEYKSGGRRHFGN